MDGKLPKEFLTMILYRILRYEQTLTDMGRTHAVRNEQENMYFPF